MVSRSSHFLVLAGALATGWVSVSAPAGLAAPPAGPVADLRRAFRAEREALLAAERERYGRGLASLEQDLVAARDYRAAVAVQRERLRLTKTETVAAAAAPPGGSAELDSAEPSGLVLPAAEATPGGGVRFDASSEALVGWEAPGASAEWALPDGWPAGGYEVEVTYAAAGVGTVVLREDRFTLTRAAGATGGLDPWVALRIGTLRMSAGAKALRLEMAPDAAPVGFALKQLRVIPNDPAAPPP